MLQHVLKFSKIQKKSWFFSEFFRKKWKKETCEKIFSRYFFFTLFSGNRVFFINKVFAHVRSKKNVRICISALGKQTNICHFFFRKKVIFGDFLEFLKKNWHRKIFFLGSALLYNSIIMPKVFLYQKSKQNFFGKLVKILL